MPFHKSEDHIIEHDEPEFIAPFEYPGDLKDILPLGKRGCKECDGLPYYCEECTRKILASLSDVKEGE
jgi:hypothetical protein